MSQSRPQRHLRPCRASCSALLLALSLVSAPFSLQAQSSANTSAQDLHGKSVDPIKLSHGRVVVLLFVRTDCPISNRYAPLFQSLSEKFRGHADFWLVYPDSAQSVPQIRAHLRAYHYSLSALRDPHHQLVKLAQATITPEAAVFDSAGNLLYHGRIDNQYEELGAPARPQPTTHELADAVTAALNHTPVQFDHVNAFGCYIADLSVVK